MSFGVLDVGFVPKTFTELVTELQTQFRAAFGQSIDVSPQSVYGQIIGIMAERLADLWNAGSDIYASWNPDNAKGSALDYLCALTGCVRNPATFSTVSVTLTGTMATLIPAGSALTVTGTGSRFTLVADVTLDGSGNGTGVFQSVTSGPVVASAGTLINIATPVFGWATATNAADATLGVNLESDAALRIRREQELALGGSATLDAIRSHILAVTGVETCTVFENVTLITDGTGLPGKAFEALVGGSAYDGQDVLNAVWANKPAGILAYGNVSGTVTDAAGNSQTVAYSTPTEIDVYVIFNINVNSVTWAGSPGLAAVKAAAVAYGDAIYTNGWDVVASALGASVFSVAGVLDVQTLIATSPTPTTSTTITITSRQFAKLDTARITVNDTPTSP